MTIKIDSFAETTKSHNKILMSDGTTCHRIKRSYVYKGYYVTNKKDWRLFEQVVAQFEKCLLPKSAIIKTPDRISDLTTNQKREVDASIRYKIGSVPILITIECRKRKNIQDIVWIEQLISKKTNIGAAKTIAVSSVGFTKNAIQKAEAHGIELRTCKYLNEEEIKNVFFSMDATICYFENTISFALLKLRDPLPPNIEEFRNYFNESIENNGNSAIAFYLSNEETPVTFDRLIDGIDNQINKNINRILQGESPRITINDDDVDLLYLWDGHKIFIQQITIDFSIVPHHRRLNERTVIEYKSDTQTFAQSIEMSTQIAKDLTFKFSYIQHSEPT
jgi:hypothetical protein